MALHLARPKQRLYSNPSLIHLFSTSSSPSSSRQDGNESGEQPPQSPSSSSSSPSNFEISSYLSGIKNSLKQQPQDGRRQFPRFDARAQNPAPSFSGNKTGGIQDLRRNLNEFRRRSEAPPPRDFQDLYKQKVLSGDYGSRSKIEGTPFENIKENLRHMESQGNKFASFENIMKTKPSENLRWNGFRGAEELPKSVFGEELEERKKTAEEIEEMKSEFIKSYDTEELGEILRTYRPQGKKEEGWFSLQELNQRLVKLREAEEEVAKRTRKNDHFIDIRNTIASTKIEEERKKKASQNLNFLDVLNGTPKYLLEPPKEELVETYFHPDNMSSGEKMKIKLAEVREEFKMSESDCGSARVQVAQLTTKIKHLSSVLHKKDKHSRKGLIAMVQRRKKLLKYMRRTDWDSYCISLSKLGLRDNPDYKF
uniref:Small ribosomal subunit protein uS15c n=4 Tax=Noccaea caerulescens TaxID=107243 RepID=A0A1J3FWH7_NOCCA